VGYRPAVAQPRTQRPVAPVPPAEVEREELAFEAEAAQAGGRTRRQIVRIVVLLTLVLLSLYVLGPGLVEVFSSAPRLATIGWWWFPLMFALEAASFACLWAVQWISIRSTPWREIITSQLAGNALGRIVPGGGAAAAALQYKMLTESGSPRASTATGLTAANLLTFGVLLGLPVLAVPAILDGAVDDTTQAILLWTLMILLALVAGGIVLVVTDRPLRWVGDRAQRIRNRLRASRAPMRGLPERLVAERDLIVSVVGERWKRALAASLGKWLLDFAVLAVAVEAVGADPSLSLLLLAYFTAQLLAQIPITPGGLGFVEAGLTGTLAIAGVAGGDAVLATLAYRLFSYWLPIPFGGVGWIVFRRRHPAAGPAPASAPAPADA
jgi:uncharacterized protein (TIRG00374 family)